MVAISEAAIAGDGIGERRVGSVHPGLVQSKGRKKRRGAENDGGRVSMI